MTECSICLEPFSDPSAVFTTKCNHTFHHKCAVQWLQENSNCPICRERLVEKFDEEEPIPVFFHIRNCSEIRDSSELIKGYIQHCIDTYDDDVWENRKHFYGSIHRKSRRRQETIYLYINLVHSDTSLKVYAGIEGYKWTIKLPYKIKDIPEPIKQMKKINKKRNFNYHRQRQAISGRHIRH